MGVMSLAQILSLYFLQIIDYQNVNFAASESNHPPKTKNHESCKVAGCIFFLFQPSSYIAIKSKP